MADSIIRVEEMNLVAYAGKKMSGGSRLWPAWQGVRRAEPSRRRRIFENFQKDSLRKLQKMHLAYFSKKFQHYALDFCTFGRNPQLVGRFLKVLDENSIDKVNLFLFLGMVAAEIETSEITSFFYNNSFRFAGGGVNPP